jgi:hypothetical protein
VDLHQEIAVRPAQAEHPDLLRQIKVEVNKFSEKGLREWPFFCFNLMVLFEIVFDIRCFGK